MTNKQAVIRRGYVSSVVLGALLWTSLALPTIALADIIIKKISAEKKLVLVEIGGETLKAGQHYGAAENPDCYFVIKGLKENKATALIKGCDAEEVSTGWSLSRKTRRSRAAGSIFAGFGYNMASDFVWAANDSTGTDTAGAAPFFFVGYADIKKNALGFTSAINFELSRSLTNRTVDGTGSGKIDPPRKISFFVAEGNATWGMDRFYGFGGGNYAAPIYEALADETAGAWVGIQAGGGFRQDHFGGELYYRTINMTLKSGDTEFKSYRLWGLGLRGYYVF